MPLQIATPQGQRDMTPEEESEFLASIAPTAEEIIKRMEAAVQRHLDTTARERGYDGILSLCTYANSANPTFQAEGLAGVQWRDAVWQGCLDILADVQAENRPVPTEAELIADLPAMVWPV
jgi:hypothetical protein